jgi:Skp family chaperone for outer membrane proteins
MTGPRPDPACWMHHRYPQIFRKRDSQGAFEQPMKRTSVFAIITLAFLLSVTAFAQGAPAPASTSKVGIIFLQDAIFGTNEGQRDLEAAQKELDPDRAQLIAKQKELEDIQNQLKVGEGKLSPEAQNSLISQGQEKKKVFDRMSEDFNTKSQKKLGDIYSRIGQKFAPVLQKYANESGFTLVLDGSNQQAPLPIVFAVESTDITKPVVDAYNTQSGVPAPVRAKPAAAGAGARPATATPAPRPAAATAPGAKK